MGKKLFFDEEATPPQSFLQNESENYPQQQYDNSGYSYPPQGGILQDSVVPTKSPEAYAKWAQDPEDIIKKTDMSFQGYKLIYDARQDKFRYDLNTKAKPRINDDGRSLLVGVMNKIIGKNTSNSFTDIEDVNNFCWDLADDLYLTLGEKHKVYEFDIASGDLMVEEVMIPINLGLRRSLGGNERRDAYGSTSETTHNATSQGVRGAEINFFGNPNVK